MDGFDFDALAQAGIEKVVVTYSGSGDEGYIDDITAEPVDLEYGTDLYQAIQEEADALLDSNYPGWEINEGAHGDMTIMVKERQVFLHHGTIIEHTEWEDQVFS
jgi:hypothetical protein